jgi:hypothetical protein
MEFSPRSHTPCCNGLVCDTLCPENRGLRSRTRSLELDAPHFIPVRIVERVAR